MVAVAVLGAGLAGLFLNILFTVYRLGVHCGECGETVAAVYVHHLSHRTESVSGVEVATVLHIIFHTPAQFVGV